MKKVTPGSVFVELLQYVAIGTEAAFLMIGPLSVIFTYSEDKLVDAICLAVAWVVVLVHLLYLWRPWKKSD